MTDKDKPRGHHRQGPIPCGSYRDVARERCAHDSDTEVDVHAGVSRSEVSSGAWVQAWVWVSDDEVIWPPKTGEKNNDE